ncbi:MAG: WhiB family transcriptional regulator [Actinomycetota bacterium]
MSTTSDLAQIIEQSPELTWLDHAACSSLDVEQLDLFFVGAGKSLSAEAKSMCAGCPVRVDCLRHAYDRDITGGYFGGVSPIKRRKLPFVEALQLIESET